MPKSLLPVGDRPILELVLLHLRKYGVEDVTVAVAYLASMIEEYFGDGGKLGMRLSYQREATPLGTAGAILQLADFNATIFMMNGDILTDLDFAGMLAEHRARRAVLTIASKVIYTDLSLGVLDTDGSGLVTGYREKPRLAHQVGLGMYIVDPEVKECLHPGERVDMPELIARLVSAGKTVATHEHPGKWVDIGHPEDYARADKEAFSSGAQSLLQA